MWAIEYGYKPLKGGSPEGELPELKKIAARSGEPGLAFATDEDTRGIDPDPHSMRFDMGNDLVEYAKSQAKLVAESLPHVVDELTKDGDGYQRARRAFGMLLARHGEVMFSASRYVGGLYVSRSHKGDAKAPKPLEVVPAERQRAALGLLEEQVFSDKPFNFPPELYNQLAASHWDHWGTRDRRARRLPGPRSDPDVAGPDPEQADVVADAHAAARQRTQDGGGRRCTDDGRAARAADEGRLLRSRYDEGRRVHQSQAGHFEPAAEFAAGVFAAAVAVGTGPDIGARGLPDGGLRRAGQAQDADRRARRRPGEARQLLAGPSAGDLGPDRQGAGRADAGIAVRRRRSWRLGERIKSYLRRIPKPVCRL